MNVVRIFTAPLQFPCGPGTTCCSIGQSEETVKALVSAMEGLGVSVKVYNVEEDGGELFTRFPSAGELLKEYGPGITPILSLNDEVVAMGVATPEEALTVISEKLE
jgi:hypothetical protein